MTTCCTHTCNQGRDCPVRHMPVARPAGPASTNDATHADRAGVDGGNFWLTHTVPPTVDLAAVRAHAAAARAARQCGQDDPAPDWRGLSLHGDSDAPDTWAAVLGVVALVVFICGTFGYMWRLYGSAIIDIINRHAATLGLPG